MVAELDRRLVLIGRDMRDGEDGHFAIRKIDTGGTVGSAFGIPVLA
jgi:hypothetical protein